MASNTSIDYGYGNVTDYKDIMDLETPTECEDEEMSKWKASCSSKASLQHEGHEDHDNDAEPLIGVYENNDVEMGYKFHNDAAFVQIELTLEEEDVEEVQGLTA